MSNDSPLDTILVGDDHITRFLDSLERSPDVYKKLTVLTLKDSWLKDFTKLFETVSSVATLEALTLDSCFEIEHLPSSLSRLRSLTTLSISVCMSLGGISVALTEMPLLTTLSISGCPRLKYISGSISTLKHLTSLTISMCQQITLLPEQIGDLQSLVSLNIVWCKSLKQLPARITQLARLQHLGVSGCWSTMPLWIFEMGNLSSLEVLGCENLEEMPAQLSRLQRLESLRIDGCPKLREIPPPAANQLESLMVSGAFQDAPHWIAEQKHLRRLTFSICPNLNSLPQVVQELPNLSELCVQAAFKFTSWPTNLSRILSLTSIVISGCTQLVEFPESVEFPPHLLSLEFVGLPALSHLPDSIGRIPSLLTLNLEGCTSVQCIPESIGGLCKLESLCLAGLINMKHLPDSLGLLKALTALSIEGCHTLETLPDSIGNLASLRSLRLSGLKHLSILPLSMGSLQSLEDFTLTGCAVGDMPAHIAGMMFLKALRIEGGGQFKSLSCDFGNLRHLTTLKLSGENIILLPESIGFLVNLRHFDFVATNVISLPISMDALESLDDFRPSPTLQVPPLDVARQGWFATRQYLRDLRQCSQRLPRNRLMFIGDGGAGKTTLRYALSVFSNPALRNSLKRDVREAIRKSWTSIEVHRWLSELGAGDSILAAFQRELVDGARLLSLEEVDIARLCISDYAIAHRVRMCIACLNPMEDLPSTPQETVEWLRLKMTGLSEDTLATIIKEECTWADICGMEKEYLKENLRIKMGPLERLSKLRAQFSPNAVQSSISSSLFSFLLHIPHIWTAGIEDHVWAVSKEGNPAPHTFMIWDFAGQLQYFPMHKFFFAASHALYVLVLDARHGYEACKDRACHWLSLIEAATQSYVDLYNVAGGLEAVRVVFVATHTDTEEYRTLGNDFLPVLRENMSNLFSPRIAISEKVFRTNYTVQNGGDLDGLIDTLCALNRDVQHTEIPSTYIAVGKSLMERVRDLKVPVLAEEVFVGIVKEAFSNDDVIERSEIVLHALQAHGFVRAMLIDDAAQLLVNPVGWLSSFASRLVLRKMETNDPIPLLSLEDVQVRVSHGEIVFPREDVYKVVQLVTAMDIGVRLPWDHAHFVFPSLLPSVLEHNSFITLGSAVWPIRPGAFIAGRRFICAEEGRSIPPTLLTKLMQFVFTREGAIQFARADAFVFAWGGAHILLHLATTKAHAQGVRNLDVAVLSTSAGITRDALRLISWLLVHTVFTFFPSLSLDKLAFCDAPDVVSPGMPLAERHPVLGFIWVSKCRSSVIIPHQDSPAHWEGRTSLFLTACDRLWEGQEIKLSPDDMRLMASIGRLWSHPQYLHLLVDPLIVEEDLVDSRLLAKELCLSRPTPSSSSPEGAQGFRLAPVPAPRSLPLFGNGVFGPFVYSARRELDNTKIVLRMIGRQTRGAEEALNNFFISFCRDPSNPPTHVVPLIDRCTFVSNMLCCALNSFDYDLALLQALHYTQTLDKEARRKALVALTRDVCTGVNFLHSNKIVHGRLVAPFAVVVCRKGGGRLLAHITDYLIPHDDGFFDPQQHEFNAKLELTSSAPFYDWRAPELRQFGGDVPPNAQSDLYSLGLLSYFILGGGKPTRLPHFNQASKVHELPELNAIEMEIFGTQNLVDAFLKSEPSRRCMLEDCFNAESGRGRFLLPEEEHIPIIPISEITCPFPQHPLGKGAFGDVSMMFWRTVPVAVKCLKDCDDEFHNEARLLTRFRHPNVVQMYGVVVEDGMYCFVMELLDRSLETLVHSDHLEPLRPSEAARLGSNVASALEYIHARGVLHCDLRSANVLVTAGVTPCAKLIDFGLSNHKSELVGIRTMLGTIVYMAPEVLCDEPKYTELSDIYSFGVLLWEISTKQIPWAGKLGANAIIQFVQAGVRPDTPGSGRDVHPCQHDGLQRIIQCCWAPEPSSRMMLCDVIRELSNIMKET